MAVDILRDSDRGVPQEVAHFMERDALGKEDGSGRVSELVRITVTESRFHTVGAEQLGEVTGVYRRANRRCEHEGAGLP